jgi:threonine dehydrogenase-like Zn-dependent dehydrogenase
VVIDFIKSGKLPLAGFVSKVYPITEMVEAFDYMDKNNASVRKILIDFD